MTISQLLIVCPLVFLAGLVDAISGGGGLISLPAYTFAGLPIHFAIGTNKMSSTLGTCISTTKYIKNGFVPWKLVPLCVIGAFAGSSLGANIALLISDHYFKLLLLFIVPIAAFYVLKTKNFDSNEDFIIDKRAIIISGIISFVIGAYDGFYGPGTGAFLILSLTFFTHMKLSNANGLTKVINWTTDIASLIVYLMNGKVILLLGIISGLFNIAGNYIGATLFTQKSGKFTRPFLMFILVLFYIKLIVELIS